MLRVDMQALLANIAAMYAVYHGPDGLNKIAQRVNGLAAVLAAGVCPLLIHDSGRRSVMCCELSNARGKGRARGTRACERLLRFEERTGTAHDVGAPLASPNTSPR